MTNRDNTKDNNLAKLCKKHHLDYDEALKIKKLHPAFDDLDVIYFFKPQLKESHRKRWEKEDAKAELHRIRKHNLFIIRELVHFIGIKEKTSISDFYFYLFNESISDKKNIVKKCADRYAHLMYDIGTNNITNIIDYFTECGISPEYFDNQEIKFTDESSYGLKEEINYYLSLIRRGEIADKVEDELAYLREMLSEHYSEIVNLDGTSMIDSIRLLVNNIIRYKRDNYNDLGKTTNIDSVSLEAMALSLPNVIENLSSDTLDKNIYTNKKSSENIRINYLLIRTIFEILCEIDELISLDRLYELLEISQKEYDNIVDTGVAENKMLFSKLYKYGFSHSIFRGDNPSLIKMYPPVKNITKEFLNAQISANEYKEKIKEQILYINHSKNADLVLSVYSMYRDALHKTI